MCEYPPILTGSPERQIAQLRDYLVRRARQERGGESLSVSLPAASSASAASSSASASASSQEQYDRLRALIVKTADLVEEHVDRVDRELHADYLAVSDFGRYREDAALRMEATARGVVESFGLEERLETMSQDLGRATQALRSLRGEIRRGYLDLPNGGGRIFGIAVAERLRVESATVTRDGMEYVQLDPGQAMGFYTATGWQFWINGAKAGWFDSADGMLHVANLAAENSLRLGADWLLTGAGGLGIRYLGG